MKTGTITIFESFIKKSGLIYNILYTKKTLYTILHSKS